MAITYNGTTIDTINHNSEVINTVTYNGTTVFSKLVPYTFPNSNAKMTSDNCLGINTYYDYRNSASQSAYKAFDNSLTTGFIAEYNRLHKAPSTQAIGKITITFPFPIYIQSITIKNPSKDITGNSSVVGGLKTGNIYVSTTAKTSNFTDSSNLYATLDRSSGASTFSYASTHTNSDYTNTAIRSICIQGNTWAHTYWHVIGDVSIAFKVAYSNLSSWKSTYGIS